MNDTTGLDALLLDHSSEMLLAVDAATLEIVAANQRVSDMLGYERSALLGRPITDLECALADVFFWEEVRQGGGNVDDVEGLYACADGSALPVVKTIRRVGSGGREMLLLRVRDERSLKHAEANLAETAAQLRATLESISEGILVTDIEGRIVNMNRRFSSMWEIPGSVLIQPGEAILAWLSGQLAEPDGSVLGADAPEAAGDGEHFDLVDLRNGKVFERRTLLQSVQDAVIGRVYSFRDITERVVSEREMVLARERAEVASRAKSEFLGMMSHELRTPMNGVIGAARALAGTALDSSQRGFVDMIRTSGEALLAIINDILDFSKLEAHKLTLEEADFDLMTLMEEVADQYALRAADKELDFAWSMTPETPVRLRGDPQRLRQILSNLVGNAVKFTGKGAVSVDVELNSKTEAGVELYFSITDTGVGIPLERLDVIFQPFEQADRSRTRRYGGTGLGLAISAQLVKMMGGAIGVMSNDGDGSTFWFTVRLQRQPATEPAPLPPDEERLGRFAGSRVLVADANEHNRRRLEGILGRWGFQVENAADAETARRMIESAEPFRVALLDQSLPASDGADVARGMLDWALPAATGLVLMTPPAVNGAAGSGAGPGVSGQLRKPVKRSQLMACLLGVLDGVHREPKPAQAEELPPAA